MRQQKRLVLASVLVTAASLAVGCGGSSPASPSGTGRVVLKGVVLGTPAASSPRGALTAKATTPGTITITVKEDVTITTTVSANGTFELDGVPEAKFTLIFSTTTTTLGNIDVPATGSNHEIDVVVQVTVTTVVLVKIEVDGKEVPAPQHDGDSDD
jgi:hypothetical protein